MRGSVLGLVSAVALVACGGGGGGTASTPAPSATPTPIAFTMNAVANSGVSGSGTITKSAGSFTVVVKLTGLAPNSSHISHIHKGSCGSPDGIALALSQVVADGSGAATATTSFQQDYSIPTGGWYVNVHAGPDLSSPANGQSISCGDLTAG